MAQYYVRIDTYWHNAPDYFVGPFSTRAEAQATIDSIRTEDNVWLSTSRAGINDISDAIRVYPTILTASEAKRSGMRDDIANTRYNVIGTRIPSNASELFDLTNEIARY